MSWNMSPAPRKKIIQIIIVMSGTKNRRFTTLKFFFYYLLFALLILLFFLPQINNSMYVKSLIHWQPALQFSDSDNQGWFNISYTSILIHYNHYYTYISGRRRNKTGFFFVFSSSTHLQWITFFLSFFLSFFFFLPSSLEESLEESEEESWENGWIQEVFNHNYGHLFKRCGWNMTGMEMKAEIIPPFSSSSCLSSFSFSCPFSSSSNVN